MERRTPWWEEWAALAERLIQPLVGMLIQRSEELSPRETR